MPQEKNYVQQLSDHLHDLEKFHLQSQPINWSSYDALQKKEVNTTRLAKWWQDFKDKVGAGTSPNLNSPPLVVEVWQKDFDNGTLRLTKPCLLRLMEDIKFNPNRPETWLALDGSITRDFSKAVGLDPNRAKNWMPLEKDFMTPKAEMPKAYRLGFFAAIASEVPGIIIDLNGKTLSQHTEHALMQRHFSTIELGDQPFLPKEGPANFGETYQAVDGTWIKNGKLGLSAHHGIHGNRAQNVRISNIEFKDYEVAAISLHGSHGVVIQDCQCLGSRTDIPVLGQFSAAIFAFLFSKALVNSAISTPEVVVAHTNLGKGIDKVFNAVIFGKPWEDPQTHFFKNPNGLIDGTTYGILLYPEGVAVNAHLEQRDEKKNTSNIWIENVTIKDTVGNVMESAAFARVDEPAKVQRGLSGEAFMPLSARNPEGTYNLNLLADLQLKLQKLKNASPMTYAELFGRVSIDKNLVEWALDGTGKQLLYNPNQNTMGLQDANRMVIPNIKYLLRYNGDVMHHVCKGVIALRIEGAESVMLKNVKIIRTKNYGPLGTANAPYQGNMDGGHEEQGQMKGYTGSYATGICIAASKNISLDKVTIDDTISHFGSATGLMIINSCTEIVCISQVIITNVSAGIKMNKPSSVLPNFPQIAQGYYIGGSCDPLPEEMIAVKGIIFQPGQERLQK